MTATTTKLTGADAIEYARNHGLTLAKHADPTEGARTGLTPDEAEEIAAEDPSLVYLDLALPDREVRIYKSGGAWCYAIWTADEYDTSGDLGIPDDTTTDEAREEAAAQFSPCRVVRIADVTADGIPLARPTPVDAGAGATGLGACPHGAGRRDRRGAMAAIYDMDGHTITEGLQGCNTCDQAIQVAIKIAAVRGCDVLLVDDDGEWIVHPDGTADEHEPEPGCDDDEDA